MKIVSWNINGLMATLKNGCFAPLAALSPDVLCIQEIRTAREPVILEGYHHFWNHGQREGYSGTAMLLKDEPLNVTCGMGEFFSDDEGRVMTAELPDFYVVGAYVPNSQKNLQRHQYRMEWDEAFRKYVCDLHDYKPVIICGDFNVARESIDIYEENQRQYWAEQGFASDERSSLESLLDEGFTDMFRELHPGERSYTWWSNRLNKRDEGRGWRLDYFIVSDDLADRVLDVTHYTDICGSDHCPIGLEVQA